VRAGTGRRRIGPLARAALVAGALVTVLLVGWAAWYVIALDNALDHPEPGMSGWQCAPESGEC
jgi:hypothetical protein